MERVLEPEGARRLLCHRVDPRTPAEIRTEEIRARLAELDRLKVEPMSAKLAGMATPEEEASLAELVTETKTLRTELASLTAPTTGE